MLPLFLFVVGKPAAPPQLGTRERPPRIRCPGCGWTPSSGDLWACAPGCGHAWNTFHTRGICPGCAKHWQETHCLTCFRWFPHDDWYAED